MRDIWTNTTWADWLKSHKVPQDFHALLETNGNGIPKKVIATAKRGEDLFERIPTDKRWTIASWHQYGNSTPVVGSLHPSYDFIQAHYKKNKKRKSFRPLEKQKNGWFRNG